MTPRSEHRFSDPRSDANALRASVSFRRPAGRRGFTLLELLVVVALLAVVAGGVIVNLDDVEADTSRRLAQREMFELKRALLRFRVDTGYLPKQGPFSALSSTSGWVQLEQPDGPAWFDSPANLYQLYENPLKPTRLFQSFLEDPIPPTSSRYPAEWDPTSGRGWNGPYLPREGLVALSADLAESGPGGATEIPALLDPYVRSHDQRYGRPYLLRFEGDSTEPQQLAELSRWTIVCAGPDGTFLDDPETPVNEADDNLELCLQ